MLLGLGFGTKEFETRGGEVVEGAEFAWQFWHGNVIYTLQSNLSIMLNACVWGDEPFDDVCDTDHTCGCHSCRRYYFQKWFLHDSCAFYLLATDRFKGQTCVLLAYLLFGGHVVPPLSDPYLRDLEQLN